MEGKVFSLSDAMIVQKPELSVLPLADFVTVQKIFDEAARSQKSILDIVAQSMAQSMLDIMAQSMTQLMLNVGRSIAQSLDSYRFALDIVDRNPWVKFVDQQNYWRERGGPEIIITPPRPRYREIVDELKQLPDWERMDALQEIVAAEMEQLPIERRIDFLTSLYSQVAPESEKTESGLSVVRFEVHHFHHTEGLITPAKITRQETGVLPTPEGKTQTGKRKGGRKQLQAHKNAIQRLQDGQTRGANFYQWKEEYQKETGNNLELMGSDASENYRKSVWEKSTGKN